MSEIINPFVVTLTWSVSSIIFDTDIEELGPKERNMESKKQKNITDSASQGMVLESYAIQLLSVHVLKEASNWRIGNKVCDIYYLWLVRDLC